MICIDRPAYSYKPLVGKHYMQYNKYQHTCEGTSVSQTQTGTYLSERRESEYRWQVMTWSSPLGLVYNEHSHNLLWGRSRINQYTITHRNALIVKLLRTGLGKQEWDSCVKREKEVIGDPQLILDIQNRNTAHISINNSNSNHHMQIKEITL